MLHNLKLNSFHTGNNRHQLTLIVLLLCYVSELYNIVRLFTLKGSDSYRNDFYQNMTF